MVALLLLSLLQAPAPVTPPATPAPATTQKPTTQKPRATAGTLAMVLFVTDNEGRNIEGVTVTLTGPVDREMQTPAGTGLRMTNLRAGTYRARFQHESFILFEKELVLRAGATPEFAVTLNPAPKPPEPPPPPPAAPEPAPTAAPELPPPGPPRTLSLPDFIERNFIGGREPQKEDLVGCSGVGQALLWQIRDPWNGRQHESADGMVYVVGGEGAMRLGDRDVALAAGTFAVVPRGTTYGFTRRGRNPLIVLAVLSGAPCAA